MIASDLLADRGALDAARAFLLTGVAVKLAAVPLFFWLLALADEVPALVLGIIIAVVDMAAFGEFLHRRADHSRAAHAAAALLLRGNRSPRCWPRC